MMIQDSYTQKYVVFLDLLGFKAKVEEVEKSLELRQELLEILHLVKTSLCDYDQVGMRFTHFSDCIIFSTNRSQDGLKEIFESIKLLTLNLLNFDFFVRGGLAVGGAHHDNDFVYGMAVNHAYILESQEAKFPITLISNEVISDMSNYDPQLSEYLTEDAQGRPFLHYLKPFEDYTPLPIYAGKLILEEPALRIIDFICNRLNIHSNPCMHDVLQKDLWFKDYWNKTTAVKGVFGRIEEGVTIRDQGHAPFTAMRRIVG